MYRYIQMCLAIGKTLAVGKEVCVRKMAPKKYNRLSISEALENAKQMLTAQAGQRSRGAKDRKSSKLYSQCQSDAVWVDLLRLETEQYWNSTKRGFA